MGREPTKNRINMHDIVAQPLGALPDAVDAILRRPEALDDVEVGSIYQECSFIILRAEEAVSVKDDRAFAALFRLLSEGFAHSAASFQEGVELLSSKGSLLQSLYSVFRAVVENSAFPLHSTAVVELIQLVGSICEGDALKDRCGSLFMPGLASIFARVHANPEEAARHYHVQRGTATALINLVKGSKQNKQRLSSWRLVAEAWGSSVDVFFQLQCVELLFRVSRVQKDALAELDGALPKETVERIRTLPNDNTLLARMVSVIEDMNEGNPRMLRYHLRQVAAAETKLTDATDVYFTPHYFTVMVTASNADNITIPYRSIRSVTLGRDGRVVFKLEDFPVKLENLLSHAAGMDTVTLHMTVERLAHFKRSPVRGWILSDLQSRKAGGPGVEAAGSAATAPAPTAASPAEAERLSGKKRQLDLVDPTTHGEKVSEASSVVTCSKTPKFEVLSPATADPAAATSSLLDMVDRIAEQSRNPKETRALFAQLRYVTEGKLEERRAASVAALNYAMKSFQEKVDATRAEAKRSREEWMQSMEPEVTRAEQFVAEIQGLADKSVRQLNEDLSTIKSNNDALNERVACIEIEVQQALAESRSTEQTVLQDMRARFEQEIRRQESELDSQLLRASDHTAALGHYIRAGAEQL